MVSRPTNLCRLCMYDLRQENRNYIDLFSEDLNKKKKKVVLRVLVGIKSCYNIEILKNKGLSTKVCETCIELLDVFYQTKLYVQGVNAVFVNTQNFDTLFSSFFKTNHDPKSDCSESSSGAESDDGIVEEKGCKDICSKIDSANIIEKKRKNTPTIKSKIAMDDFRKKFEPYKKKYKVKSQLLNSREMKLGKKRGRPPKVNGTSEVAIPSPKQPIEPHLDVPETSELVAEEPEPQNTPPANEKADEMDGVEEYIEIENDNSKRASSGRILKPICRKDFVQPMLLK